MCPLEERDLGTNTSTMAVIAKDIIITLVFGIFLAQATMETLHITSYNSTGLNDQRIDFINSFLDKDKTDILFLQETWLYYSNLSKLNDIHGDYMSCGVSGMSDTK